MSQRGNVRLPVLPAGFELRDDVPATRADCPIERPCPHVHCEWNTWMRTGLDSPGRRHIGGKLPASTIQPTPAQNNCGADYADAVQHGADVSVRQIAEAYGITERQVRRYTESGLRKLGLMGVDPRTMRTALRKLLSEGR